MGTRFCLAPKKPGPAEVKVVPRDGCYFIPALVSRFVLESLAEVFVHVYGGVNPALLELDSPTQFSTVHLPAPRSPLDMSFQQPTVLSERMLSK